MSLTSPHLLAAEQVSRPEIPLEGFRIVRPPGAEWHVIQDRDGCDLYLPGARIQRAAAAGDGSLLAVEVADDGHEEGRLLIIDGDGTALPVATPRLRYADLAWAGPHLHLVDASGAWLLLDTSTSTAPTTLVLREANGSAPPRLVPVGRQVLLAVTEPGTDRSSLRAAGGSTLLDLPPPVAVSRAGQTTLVVTRSTLHLLGAGPADTVVVRACRPRGDVDGVLLHATAQPDGAVLHCVTDGHSRLIELDADLQPIRDVSLGSDARMMTATGLGWADGTTWVRIESPAGPPHLVDLTTLAAHPDEGPPSPPSRLLTVTAEDGTSIELVVTGEVSGPAPTLLEVYGGFGVVDVAAFEPSVTAWCALGGRHVTARIRGGGGAGSAWHTAAQGPRKARAVADTVAVARALVASGLSRPGQLVLAGASHGGLIAASAALAAPGLVAAAVCTAAPLDPHRLDENPLGAAWREEFGDVTDPVVRAAMDDYAPLRRLERWPLGVPPPAFLLTTFADDARVSRHSTDRLEAELRRRGSTVVRRHRPAMGHGRNAASDVHDFAASVLDFALDPSGAP